MRFPSGSKTFAYRSGSLRTDSQNSSGFLKSFFEKPILNVPSSSVTPLPKGSSPKYQQGDLCQRFLLYNLKVVHW